MRTAHLGRRLGDWLGIVPEDEIPWTPAELYELHELARAADRAEPSFTPSPVAALAPPATMPPPALLATPESPAPSPVRSDQPFPEPATTALTFRDVVNQRRAAMQRRASSPQAPTRW